LVNSYWLQKIVDAVRQGYRKSLIAKMFGVSRKTGWCKGNVERVIRTLKEQCLPSGSVFYGHGELVVSMPNATMLPILLDITSTKSILMGKYFLSIVVDLIPKQEDN